MDEWIFNETPSTKFTSAIACPTKGIVRGDIEGKKNMFYLTTHSTHSAGFLSHYLSGRTPYNRK